MAAMAMTPPLARRRSPGLGRQELREPGVELRHALLRYGDRDLLVGHLLDLGGLGRSVMGLAALGLFGPVRASVPASMAMASMLATPAPPAATGKEPGEESVELRQALFGNVDCHLLVLRGGEF